MIVADCFHTVDKWITLYLPIKDGPYFRFCSAYCLQGWSRGMSDALQCHLRSEMPDEPETDCECRFCAILDPGIACQVCPWCLEYERWVRFANEHPEEYEMQMEHEDEFWSEQWRLKGY
jgi:hypothetical protein